MPPDPMELERAFREMTDWIRTMLRDLHDVEHEDGRWFIFSDFSSPYIRCDDWRSICVDRRNNLIAITLINNNGALSDDFIDVALITKGGHQVDRVRMLPSKTNPHERWCHLRWADLYMVVKIDFIPVHGPRRF